MNSAYDIFAKIANGEAGETGEDKTPEYRVEIIPLDAGADGRSSAILNRLAKQGWYVRSIETIPAPASAVLPSGEQVPWSLVVFLERQAM